MIDTGAGAAPTATAEHAGHAEPAPAAAAEEIAPAPRGRIDAVDPENAAVVIAAWPTGRAEWGLLRWLIDETGIPWGRVYTHRISPRIAAYNQGVQEALRSGCEHLLFFDHDVIPVGPAGNRPGSARFLEAAEADILCMPCRLDIPGAWADPEAFHCGAWRTTRAALEHIGAPWFLEEYTPDGCALSMCVCAWFARKARSAGCTITRAGWAEHVVKKLPHAGH